MKASRIGPIFIAVLILAGCQDAARQQESRALRGFYDYRGDVRPIYGPISLGYGPHENVSIQVVTTYEETVDGKTDTYQETIKGSSSAKSVGKLLNWEIDFTEFFNPGGKLVSELTAEELTADLAYMRAGDPGKLTRAELEKHLRALGIAKGLIKQEDADKPLPLALRMNPLYPMRMKDPDGLPLIRLRLLTDRRGALKDITADFPASRAKGRSEDQRLAKQLRREAALWHWEFSQAPINVGDRLYRSGEVPPAVEGSWYLENVPEWMAAGVTTFEKRSAIVARFSHPLIMRTPEGRFGVPAKGYVLIDIDTGLLLRSMILAVVTDRPTKRLSLTVEVSATVGP